MTIRRSINENQIYPQKLTGPLIVLKYHHAKQIDVKFLNTGTLLTVTAQQIHNGTIRDPLAPVIFGKGYYGIGPYKKSINKKITKAYSLWYDMLDRCYNTTKHNTNAKYSTYKDAEVDPEWLNFQNFAKWLESNYIENYHLDKDLSGSKIYGPNTCRFIPKNINVAEAHLRKLANENTEFKDIYECFKLQVLKQF